MQWVCGKTDQTESTEIPLSTVENTDEHSDGYDENEIPDDFPEIDHISLYTLRIYVTLSIPTLLVAGCSLSYVFTTGTVSYRCLVKECEDPVDTTLNPSWLPNAVPYTDGKPTTCTRYTVLNGTDLCSTTAFTEETESCDSWIYDPEELTILNEVNAKALWDLTCDNNLWKLALPGTINNVGQFVGLIFAGYFSDKYGRRNVLTTATIMNSIFGIIRSFSINYEMFVIFEFLGMMVGGSICGTGFLIGMEFVGARTRVPISIMICCMFPVGEVLLALCAMWLRSWRYIILVFYLPGLLAIFLPSLMPESVRWLLSKGRVKEAEAVLRKVAAGNGIDVSQKSITLIRISKKKMQEKTEQKELGSSGIFPVGEIFENRAILTRLVICAFCWVAIAFVFYGLSLGSVGVPGNKYINFILAALVEIPGQLTSWILMENVGRKPTLSGALLLSGVFCIVTIFVPEDWWYLPLITFLGGKLCITVAFSATYVYTAEMFPTPLRHSLLGFCSMTARIGSMIAPQMPVLAVYMTSLPLILFGVVAIIASVLSVYFPETVGTKLPDTMYEATNIGKVKSYTNLVPSTL